MIKHGLIPLSASFFAKVISKKDPLITRKGMFLSVNHLIQAII